MSRSRLRDTVFFRQAVRYWLFRGRLHDSIQGTPGDTIFGTGGPLLDVPQALGRPHFEARQATQLFGPGVPLRGCFEEPFGRHHFGGTLGDAILGVGWSVTGCLKAVVAPRALDTPDDAIFDALSAPGCVRHADPLADCTDSPCGRFADGLLRGCGSSVVIRVVGPRGRSAEGRRGDFNGNRHEHPEALVRVSPLPDILQSCCSCCVWLKCNTTTHTPATGTPANSKAPAESLKISLRIWLGLPTRQPAVGTGWAKQFQPRFGLRTCAHDLSKMV